MPANVVKTKSDDKKWRKALRIAAKYSRRKGRKVGNKYALAMHIFKNMKRKGENAKLIDLAVYMVETRPDKLGEVVDLLLGENTDGESC